MKIGLVQFSPVWEDKEINKEKLTSLLQEEVEDVDLLIFPEMTLTGFTMRSRKYAEKVNGESFKYFSSVARKFNCDVIAGIIENSLAKYFNTLLHITKNGKLKNHYHKIHPFSFSNEDKHYSAGEKPIVTDINGWKTGLSICYDLRFPELYRLYGKQKVNLIIDIANWPDTRIKHWLALLKARAIENQCFVVGVNRVGDEPRLHYNGSSGIFDPMGRTVVKVVNEERVIFAEIEKKLVIETRKKLPFLDDIKLI
ncbi:MAG: nitrilase family protein [Ignavibacteria bacterium]|nr:MAG: nitrilase family protein [Ignavibacteria bacterium]